jgi:hypothetical protein
MNIGLARLHETTIGNNVLLCIVPQIEYANNARHWPQHEHSTTQHTARRSKGWADTETT